MLSKVVLPNGKKLTTYAEFETVVKFEDYPDVIRNQK